MSVYDSILILSEGPFTGYMPVDVRALLNEQIPDELLASLVACVDNHANHCSAIWMKETNGRNTHFGSGGKLWRN